MKRIAFLLVALFIPQLMWAQSKITVDSVFQKYYQATGGIAKWDSIRTYSIDRKYTSTNVASYDAEIRGSLTDGAFYKNEIIKGRGFIYGIKGTDSWRKVPLGSADKVTKYQVSALSGAKQTSMRLELYDMLVPFYNYQKRGFIATLIGEEKLKTATVQKVELQSKDARYTLYFDATTGLLVQSKQLVAGEEIVSDYSAYVKANNGLLYPSKISETNVKNKAAYIITSKLTVNGQINPDLFKK